MGCSSLILIQSMSGLVINCNKLNNCNTDKPFLFHMNHQMKCEKAIRVS